MSPKYPKDAREDDVKHWICVVIAWFGGGKSRQEMMDLLLVFIEDYRLSLVIVGFLLCKELPQH